MSGSDRRLHSRASFAGTASLIAGVLCCVHAGTLPAHAQRSDTEGWDLIRGDAGAWQVRRDTGARGDDPRIEVADGRLSIRTGASSVLHWPDVRPTGSYRLEATFALLDPQRRNEGFGVIFGGRDLQGSARRYVYVLLRQDGMTLLKRRGGDDTRTLSDWAASDAVRSWAARPEGADRVRNSLVVEVNSERVRVLVNEVALYDFPREDLEPVGSVGLRINHGISLVVERLVLFPT